MLLLLSLMALPSDQCIHPTKPYKRMVVLDTYNLLVCYLIAEKFHLQTNELYGVCMATKCQGAQERIFTHRYDDLQEGKERREMSSEQSGQTQLQFGSKDLELKSNEAYSAFQITTVDNEVHGQIATKIVCHHNA